MKIGLWAACAAVACLVPAFVAARGSGHQRHLYDVEDSAGEEPASAQGQARRSFCHVQGPRSARQITVKSTDMCVIHLGSSSNGRVVIFRKMTLLTDPRHGTVSLRENGRVIYTPQASYRGPDDFKLEICGVRDNGDRCWNSEVSASVE